MECVRVRFASHCGGRRSFRPHYCARFQTPCTMMRSNRPSVATAVRTLRARSMRTGVRMECARAIGEPLWWRT
eukprot:5292553-Lingulodinium_polyedra.AAC.1